MLERALAEAQALYRRNQDLQRGLSTLREDLGRTARTPPEVAELLDNLRLAAPRLIYGNRPAGDGCGVPALAPFDAVDRPAAALVQRLPVWARGLAGIDLHVATPGVGNGVLASNAQPWHGRTHSLAVTLPPLATLMLVLEG